MEVCRTTVHGAIRLKRYGAESLGSMPITQVAAMASTCRSIPTIGRTYMPKAKAAPFRDRTRKTAADDLFGQDQPRANRHLGSTGPRQSCYHLITPRRSSSAPTGSLRALTEATHG